jgi:predicted RNase H-like HicB family nuclease
MTYRVALRHSAEGVSVSVPGLPVCWSQGRDEAEALENVEDAIREYLAAVEAQLADQDVRELEVEL